MGFISGFLARKRAERQLRTAAKESVEELERAYFSVKNDSATWENYKQVFTFKAMNVNVSFENDRFHFKLKDKIISIPKGRIIYVYGDLEREYNRMFFSPFEQNREFANSSIIAYLKTLLKSEIMDNLKNDILLGAEVALKINKIGNE